MPAPPVSLREGFTWDIEDMFPDVVSILILHLINHDFTVNDQELFPMLGIDMATRGKTENMPNVVDGNTKQYRIINKALATELLGSLLLTHLNSANRVTSWCLTNANGLPNYFAPPKAADIEVSYPGTGGTPAFHLIAEVSALRDVDETFYATQLEQAWRHALYLANEKDDEIIYALVINSGQIGSDTRLQQVYMRFMNLPAVKENKQVRVVPIYAADVAVALRDLDIELHADEFHYGSDSLARVFDRLQQGVLEGYDDEDWMRHIWLKTIDTQPTLDI